MTLNDLEQRNGHFCIIFTEFGNFKGVLHKSGWQSRNYGQFTITVSSSKRLQRDRAMPTVQIPSRFINARLTVQYLPSYRFDKKSYMSFRLTIGTNIGDLEWPWIAKWPLFWVILPKLLMALILHHFIKFVYHVVVKQLLGLPRSQSLLLIVYDHFNTICASIQRLFRQNKLW